MQIIAVANEKGGVAKTTTVISLGGALVEAGYEVLMVDLDPQANLTLGLGLEPPKVRRSIADVFMNAASLLSVSRETGIPGLDMVPSNPDMGLAERFLPMRYDYEYLLKNALVNLAGYNFVLLDCPPSLGAVTFNALTAAQRVITPTQPEYFSAYGLRSVMGLIRRVRGLGATVVADSAYVSTAISDSRSGTVQGGASQGSVRRDTGSMPVTSGQAGEFRQGPESQGRQVSGAPTSARIPSGTNPRLIYHVLITMMDRRNRIHRTLCEQLQATFGDGLLKTVIEVDTKLRESSVAGQPITHYYSHSRGALQYRALAQEIVQYAKEKAV